MNRELKKLVAGGAAVLMVLAAYYGSYLPYRKSSAYIAATSRVEQATTLDRFAAEIGPVLDMYSPIGQEELVRTTTSNVVEILKVAGRDPELTRASLEFIMPYWEPILARGKGMSFGQNLYLLGIAYEVAALQTQQAHYLEDAYRFFRWGNELGPRRPQPLYGLFDIYRFTGQIDPLRGVTEKILTYWPEDERTRQLLGQMEEEFGGR